MKVGNGKFHSPRKLPVSFIITPKITPGLSFFHCTFALLYGITWIGLRGWIFFWNFFYSAATSAKPSKLSTFIWPFNQTVAFIYWFFFVKTFVFITQKHIHQTIFRYEKEEREAKWLLWNLIELCGWKLFFWAFGSLVFFNFSAYGMSFSLSNMKQQHTINKKTRQYQMKPQQQKISHTFVINVFAIALSTLKPNMSNESRACKSLSIILCILSRCFSIWCKYLFNSNTHILSLSRFPFFLLSFNHFVPFVMISFDSFQIGIDIDFCFRHQTIQ